MKKAFISCLFLLLLIGCLDMDEQVAYFFYDKPKDELHLLLCYKGIYSDNDISDSGTQMSGFFKPDWEIAFGGWLGHVTKKGIQDNIDDENSPEVVKKFAAFLLKNITVTTGKCFLDEDKRLSCYQTITVTNASKIIGLFNEITSQIIIEQTYDAKKLFSALDKKSIDLFTAAAKEKHQWLQLEGQSIRFSFPISDETFMKAKAELLEKLKSCPAKDYKTITALFALNDISFTRDGNFITLILGNKDVNKAIPLLLKPKQGDYKDNMVEFARKEFGINQETTEESIADQFISGLVDSETVKKIEEFIRKLGYDDFETRENATLMLIKMDSLALSWIRKASKSEDPEVRLRAKKILEAIAISPEEKEEIEDNIMTIELPPPEEDIDTDLPKDVIEDDDQPEGDD
ncbi:MAG: hypothetical protein HY811_01295 [Planctomycetes bacterium]|nr:hypothetical protein [Planctomycetota bacterium]